MRRFMLVLSAAMLVGLMGMPAAAAEVDVPEVFGAWVAEDGGYTMQIAPCDEALCATVVSADDEATVGQVILVKLDSQPNEKGAFRGGEFTDPKGGKKYYRCDLKIDDQGRLRLEGQTGVMSRGRVVLSRFPTKMHWTRSEN